MRQVMANLQEQNAKSQAELADMRAAFAGKVGTPSPVPHPPPTPRLTHPPNAVGALGPEYYALPVWGVGHSLSAILQLLVSARYPGFPMRGSGES